MWVFTVVEIIIVIHKEFRLYGVSYDDNDDFNTYTYLSSGSNIWKSGEIIINKTGIIQQEYSIKYRHTHIGDLQE